MLQQVWINLLDNAIKFSPADGVITVTISQDALHTRISVSIEGVGIEPSAEAHIFDKFYQADPSHATQGNGLGLSIVNKFVDAQQIITSLGNFKIADQLAVVFDRLGDAVNLHRCLPCKNISMWGKNDRRGNCVRFVQPVQSADSLLRFFAAGGQKAFLVHVAGQKNTVSGIERNTVIGIYQRGLHQLLHGGSACRLAHFMVCAVIPHDLVQRRHKGGIASQFPQRYFHH